MPSNRTSNRGLLLVGAALTLCMAVIHGKFPQFGGWTITSNGRIHVVTNVTTNESHPPITNVTNIRGKENNATSDSKSVQKPTQSAKGNDDKQDKKNENNDKSTSSVDDGPFTESTNTTSKKKDKESKNNSTATDNKSTSSADDGSSTESTSSTDKMENNTNTDIGNNSTLSEDPEDPFLVGTVEYVQTLNRPGDDRNLRIPYYCDGPIYQDFAKAMREFAQQKIDNGDKPATWGQRQLPPNSRVLVFGNSHTRQIGMQLAMQHDLPLPHTEVFDEHISGKMARRFDLGQNRSLFVVANSYVPFSKDWKFLLERQIQFKMEDLDFIMVSIWNSCTSYVQTTFQTEMLALSKEIEGVDCAHIPGPTVTDIAEVYDGPLAFVSMFAKYRDEDVAVAKEEVTNLQKTRSKLEYMDARQYIEEMEMECGAPKKTSFTPDCDHSEESGKLYHRCVGPKGGHPDMLAWDLTELVWQYFPDEQ